jgi:hypothetical protein
MRNSSENVTEKIKTHLYSITLFENHAVYEIMWKTKVEPESPLMTALRRCISR